MGNLAGWPWWKVISLTGQAGSGTDYQVKLTMGDSAGGDFHLEGHCTNFPQDIRITDDDGTTLLDHFVEDLTADPIVVHVEVKDDLGSNRDIRIYYGKSGETTASNGANTFVKYHGAASSNFIDSLNIDPTASFIYEAKVKLASGAQVLYGIANTQVRTDDYINTAPNAANGNNYVVVGNENVQTYIEEAMSVTHGIWYYQKIIFDGTTVKGYHNDNEISTGGVTSNLPDEMCGLFMKQKTLTGEQAWSFIRKYNSPEPAFSSAGAEQSAGSRTSVFYGPLVGPFGGPI